jgi:hypothetical protein
MYSAENTSNTFDQLYEIVNSIIDIRKIELENHELIKIHQGEDSLYIDLFNTTIDNQKIHIRLGFELTSKHYIYIYDAEHKNTDNAPDYIIQYDKNIQQLSQHILNMNLFTKEQIFKIIEKHCYQFDIYKFNNKY